MLVFPLGVCNQLMSLTYIVLNLLLQNKLKPRKMQGDIFKLSRLLRMELMRVQINWRQSQNMVRELEKKSIPREVENETRELQKELENDVRELENTGREIEEKTRELKNEALQDI